MGYKRRIGNGIANLLAFALRLGNEKSYRFFLDALWERYPTTSRHAHRLDIALHCPQPASPNPADEPLVERIFAAYRQAKLDQHRQDSLFQPSRMWQNILRAAYGDVTASTREDDLSRFHYFLTNFGSWPDPTAIEESQLIRQCQVDKHKRRHVEQKIMAPLIQWWLKFESDGRDLSALEMPRHGNFGGLFVDSTLISPGSVFADVHARLLAGLLQTERPVIGELGGGFGRLLYFLSRYRQPACYVGFDLPETLCCAAYYLMKTFPDKRFLLYGERDWNRDSLTQYDFLLLPSFEIPKLPDNSVDLFVNENSLGEIEARACENYVREICRCSRAFWHRNHESLRFQFDDHTSSLLNREYPIPADEFVQVMRYADVASLVRADRLNHDGDMFWYYYRRKAQD